MNATVAIVVVSHSADVARSVAAMAGDTVGGVVRVAWSGGTSTGALGTDVTSILTAVQSVLTDAGVAILVDLGGAETNTEMALESLPPTDRTRVHLCDAPLVEGAVMAATRAATGAPLREVCDAAEGVPL